MKGPPIVIEAALAAPEKERMAGAYPTAEAVAHGLCRYRPGKGD